GGPLVQGSSYPFAVAGAISSLPLVSGVGPSFPFVPYAGVYAPYGSLEDGAASVALLEQLELRAIAQARRDAIPGDPSNGPQLVAQADLTPLAGGTAVTPQGQVILLNADGTVQEVQLARGPVVDTTYIRFRPPTGGKVVEAALTEELLRTQLNLVISRL